MAQRVYVQYLDDLDNSLEANETVEFGLDGIAYTIDLSDGHAAQLRDVLDRYVAVARKTSGKARRNRIGAAKGAANGSSGRRQPSDARREYTRAVRQWAREQGVIAGGNTGKIPQAAYEAYHAAHPDVVAPAS